MVTIMPLATFAEVFTVRSRGRGIGQQKSHLDHDLQCNVAVGTYLGIKESSGGVKLCRGVLFVAIRHGATSGFADAIQSTTERSMLCEAPARSARAPKPGPRDGRADLAAARSRAFPWTLDSTTVFAAACCASASQAAESRFRTRMRGHRARLQSESSFEDAACMCRRYLMERHVTCTNLAGCSQGHRHSACPGKGSPCQASPRRLGCLKLRRNYQLMRSIGGFTMHLEFMLDRMCEPSSKLFDS